MKIWLQIPSRDNVFVEVKDGKNIIFKGECCKPELIPGPCNAVELLIDADTGQIINWQTCSEMVKKFIEESKN